MHYKIIPVSDLQKTLDLAEYCFPTKPGTDRPKELTRILEQEAGLGGYVDKQLMTQLLLFPFQMNIFGVNMAMGGMATVSTYPEYRQGGYTKELIFRSLKLMRERGQVLSVLAPFAEGFYRKLGWEVFFERSDFSIPATEMSLRKSDTGKMIRFKGTDQEWHLRVRKFHDQIVAQRNGLTYRDEAWWNRLNTRDHDAWYAVHLDEQDQIQGYVRYQIHFPELKILDFYALDAKTERVLWNYLETHTSQISKVTVSFPAQDSFAFHLNKPDVYRDTYFDNMIRVVDVEQFLKQYPFQKQSDALYIEITDNFATWNNHVFKIDLNGTVTKPKNVAPEKVLKMDIGSFSAMMVGYHDVNWYVKQEYAKAKERVSQQWEAAVPKGYPVFHDEF